MSEHRAARTLLAAAAALGCSPDDWYTVRPRDAATDAPDTPRDADTADADAPCGRRDAGAANGCPSGQMRCDGDCVPGPAHLYRGEDDACDTAGSYHATHAEAGYAAGRVGRAFALGGDDARQYVALPPDVGDFGASDFTVSLWFVTTRDGDLLSKRPACWNTPPFTGLDLRMSRAGDLLLEVWTTGGHTAYHSAPGLNDGRWHHVAIVRRGEAMSLHVDGAAVSTGAIRGAMTDPSRTPTYLGVGRCASNAPGANGTQDGTTWFDGLLDEVGFFPRALSERELTATAQGRCAL